MNAQAMAVTMDSRHYAVQPMLDGEMMSGLSRSLALLVGPTACACAALYVSRFSLWLSFAAMLSLIALPFLISGAFDKTSSSHDDHEIR